MNAPLDKKELTLSEKLKALADEWRFGEDLRGRKTAYDVIREHEAARHGVPLESVMVEIVRTGDGYDSFRADITVLKPGSDGAKASVESE